MRIVVLGGYGEMGRVTAIDLAETCGGCEIVIAGRDGRKAKAFARSFGRKNMTGVGVDASNIKQTASVLKGADVVINAVQYYYNLNVMEAALAAGANYVDLGGLFHTTRKQLGMNGRFKKKNLIAVLGCGATPGITNVMAGFGARYFDRVDSIGVQFADRDYTKYDAPFVVPYSMRTVFDEFTKKPAVFRNGKLEFAEPLGGIGGIRFPQPVGKKPCFNVLHSEVATFPSSFRKKGIKDCSFKGGFERGFVEKVKFLIDAGFASDKEAKINGVKVVPREITVALLNRFIPSKHVKIKDVEFLRVEIKGRMGGRRKTLELYCRAESDKKWNIPAGTWDTGVPPSIIAQMIGKGEINERGVLPPELCVPPGEFFQELAKRKMRIYLRVR